MSRLIHGKSDAIHVAWQRVHRYACLVFEYEIEIPFDPFEIGGLAKEQIAFVELATIAVCCARIILGRC